MEKNKRVKNTILLWFIGSLFIMIVFLLVFFYNLKPSIDEIELQKLDLKKDYDYFVETNKKWLNFNDFKALTKNNVDLKKDLYINSVVNFIDEKFYSTNISNNTTSSFDTFITKKQKDLNSFKSKLDLKEEQVNKILPMYTDSAILWDKLVMNDFNLINNIESFFKTFDLAYWNKISINNVSPVLGFESSKSNQNLPTDEKNNATKWIEADIFSIPMVLNISWTKLNLQNFLHYLENVWTFDIVWNDIELYKDDYIKNISQEKLYFYNDNIQAGQDYNIYNNQLINIRNIKVNSDFIDSTVSPNENIDLDVEIVFFVRWLPNSKKQEFINKFLSDYNKLNSSIDSKIKELKSSKDDNDKLKEEKLLKLKNYISTIENQVKSINKDMGDIEQLDIIYKKVLEYNKNFLNIKDIFDKIFNS